MKEQYAVGEHIQHIYETDLDGFLNYLSNECDLSDVLRDAFENSGQEKNLSRIGVFISGNKWKQMVFDMLDAGNSVLWWKLREYAQKLHDSAEEDFAIQQYEQNN